MSESRPLTPEMVRAIKVAREHGGRLARHAGGKWAWPDWLADSHRARAFGTTTIKSLVGRGLMVYSKWQGRRYPFPTEAGLVECGIKAAQCPTPAAPATLPGAGSKRTAKLGEWVKFRSGRGEWTVQVLEISEDGKFARVGTGLHGQFGKPRWVAVVELSRG